LRPLGKQPYLGQVLEIKIVEDDRSSREVSLLVQPSLGASVHSKLTIIVEFGSANFTFNGHNARVGLERFNQETWVKVDV